MHGEHDDRRQNHDAIAVLQDASQHIVQNAANAAVEQQIDLLHGGGQGARVENPVLHVIQEADERPIRFVAARVADVLAPEVVRQNRSHGLANRLRCIGDVSVAGNRNIVVEHKCMVVQQQ